MTDNVITFPGTEEEVTLPEWFESITDRVGDRPLEAAIVILVSDDAQQLVFLKEDMRKDRYAGILQIAMMEGVYGSVSY